QDAIEAAVDQPFGEELLSLEFYLEPFALRDVHADAHQVPEAGPLRLAMDLLPQAAYLPILLLAAEFLAVVSPSRAQRPIADTRHALPVFRGLAKIPGIIVAFAWRDVEWQEPLRSLLIRHGNLPLQLTVDLADDPVP